MPRPLERTIDRAFEEAVGLVPPSVSGRARRFCCSSSPSQVCRPIPRYHLSFQRYMQATWKEDDLWWADSWADAKAQWEEKEEK